MTEIKYNTIDYISFINKVAETFNTRVKGRVLTIPAAYGNGYLWAENLPNGISVLISDTQFKESLVLHQTASNNQSLTLQFNESLTATVNKVNTEDEVRIFDMQQNIVLLTNSIMTAKFVLPANTKLRSVKLIFEKRHLLQFFDNETVDILIGRYFSELLNKGNIEPIDADYRILMDELVKEEIDHPLRIQFIQNRVMVLLEKFIRKFLNKIRFGEDSINFTEDQIGRLMKVEALLVKDFSTAPFTISVLSRHAAMSATKLKKDFKYLYGLPIYEYFQKNRMMHAKKLILENDFTMKEVGNKVGYTNLGHFAASFKKEFGILPSEVSAITELPQLAAETFEPK